jgi:hypothetical protein
MTADSVRQDLNPQPLPPVASGGHPEPWGLIFGPHPDPWRSGPHPEPWSRLASIFITAVTLREAAREVEDGGVIARIAQRMIDDCGTIGPRRPPIPVPTGGEEPPPRPNWAAAALASAVIAQAAALPNTDLQAAALAAARELLPAGRG